MGQFDIPSIGNDVFAHHGRQIIADSIEKNISIAPSNVESTARAVGKEQEMPKEPVGILGAGAAGLYTALILDDLGIPYKIIEGRDRVGGRLYTHKFKDPVGEPYNYFDVGAMRFPQIASMRRVFHLFNYSPLNENGLALKAKLKPFYFTGAANNGTFFSYNGITVKQTDVPDGDPFQSKATIKDTDSGPYISAGAKAIADDVIAPFATRLLDDLKNNTTTGWEYMKSFDKFSTRAYMSVHYRPSREIKIPNEPLPTDVINWCETFDKSTGWYDRSLTETVLEAVAFGWKPNSDLYEQVPWFCIDGGAFQIADTMYQFLKKRNKGSFIFNKRVTGINAVRDGSGKPTAMKVTTDNYEQHQFPHVITTLPLPVMRIIDMTDAGLSPMQSHALRTLNYGPSIKIGMQFRTAWWTNGSDLDGRPLNIIGGQTYTDSVLRTVVYPSFGDVKAGKTTTLIGSYCWTEDAERWASLIASQPKVLDEVVLKELAKIHNVSIEFLRGQLIDTFAWSWSHDPFSMGAFAFFGPGKFKNVYASLTTPAAEGRFHFAGEAISVRHAWVEGALDSAWRAVFELLLQPGYTHLMQTFTDRWGLNAEWFSAPRPEEKGTPEGAIPRGRYDIPFPSVPRGGVPPKMPSVDTLLKSSLLLRHIAASSPEV